MVRAIAGNRAPLRGSARVRGVGAVLGLALGFQPGMAHAVTTLPEGTPTPVYLSINANPAPRWGSGDARLDATRVDVSLLAPSRSAVRPLLAVGVLPAATNGWRNSGQQVSIDVGVHWRHRLDEHQIDFTAWRRLAQPDAYTLVQLREPAYGARMELNLAPARKGGLFADRGFLGFQLEGGGRITIKRRNGKPMLYYRTVF